MVFEVPNAIIINIIFYFDTRSTKNVITLSFLFLLFKVEAKIDPGVKFVDVVHNSEAYVRCDCQETAKKIAEENRWPQTRLLTGKYSLDILTT